MPSRRRRGDDADPSAAVQFCVAILDHYGNSLGGIYPPLPESLEPEPHSGIAGAKERFYLFSEPTRREVL